MKILATILLSLSLVACFGPTKLVVKHEVVKVYIPTYVSPPAIDYTKLPLLPVHFLSVDSSMKQVGDAYLMSLRMQKRQINMLENYLDLYKPVIK
jgi:hypothetical protein